MVLQIAVECDGDAWHGSEQAWTDAGRQRFLERIGGWQFFRVRGGEYYSNRKNALEPLWKLLRTNDVQQEENINVSLHSQIVNEEVEIINMPVPHEKNALLEFQRNSIPDLFSDETFQENSLKNQTPSIPSPIKMSDDSNSNEILVYTSLNNVYKVQKREINDRLQAIERIDFEVGEKAIYMTGEKNYSGYLIVAFENGKIGKISMNSYHTEHNRKKLKNAFNNESKLIFIEHVVGDIDLITLSSINKVVLFNTCQINPVDSRNTKGVQVMKQKDGSKMIKVKRAEQAKLNDPEYYRKSECLNVVGYYLKQDDEI